MSEAEPAMRWSSQLNLTAAPPSLHGDKIILPQEALEQLLNAAPQINTGSGVAQGTSSFDPFDPYSVAAQRHARSQFVPREQKLPHPLTFRLVNPENGRLIYAGIQEFSTPEGCVTLSAFLVEALGFHQPKERDGRQNEEQGSELETVSADSQKVTVHFEELPKGTFVKLRPLEAGYDPEDWKALLESHLRASYTTLTRGEVLTIRPNATEAFQFLVDEFKPAGNGICVVDTDLEVDIEALNEEQALETMKKYAQKHRLASGTDEGSSRGGTLKFMKRESGQVLAGDYVDYELSSWPRAEDLQISLEAQEDNLGQLDLFVSPYSSYQRAKPREDEHIFADFEDRPSKRVKLTPSNIELETAQSLYVTVHASPAPSRDEKPRLFTIVANVAPSKLPNGTASQSIPAAASPGADEAICSNCHHHVPRQSIALHEGYCRRNNTRCSQCDRVFQRNSSVLKEHWHCDREGCRSSGATSESQTHHIRLAHTPLRCPSCSYPDDFPSLSTLAQHRTSICPGKHILCRFCHLAVPQGGSGDDPFAAPDPEVVLSGMTAHEVADGARTTECHLCSRIIRLRDMETHLKNHDFERRTKPTPRVCRNVLCGRTLDGASANGDTRSASKVGQGPGNEVGLCSLCYSPLYVTSHDPEGRALKRRVERRYLTQLTAGCGKAWCRNPFCKTGRTALAKEGQGEPGKLLTIAEAMPIVKPYVEGLLSADGETTPLHFCTDEANQRRRNMAGLLEAEGKSTPTAKWYGWPWCVAALEAQKGDLGKAQEWLKNFAPTVEEETQRRP